MSNAGEVEQVAGRIIQYGPTEIHPSDPNMPTLWMDWSAADSLCGPYESDYVVCGDAIIINGDWRTLELDDNREIRTYPDGTQALFINGKFESRVTDVNVSIVDGPVTVNATTGTESAGFGYSSGNSLTASFRLIPGN